LQRRQRHKSDSDNHHFVPSLQQSSIVRPNTSSVQPSSLDIMTNLLVVCLRRQALSSLRATIQSANNMSQGDVYAKIIEEVVEASRADFEENGVSSLTLQELQQVSWQSFAFPHNCIFLYNRMAPFSHPNHALPLHSVISTSLKERIIPITARSCLRDGQKGACLLTTSALSGQEAGLKDPRIAGPPASFE